MAGILPDAGFIYQRKVFLYYFLEYLYKRDVSECKLELTFKRQTRIKNSYNYSIDFSILTNLGVIHYFEVKDRENIHRSEELKPIFINFYDRYKSNKIAKFILVHSWDQRQKLADLYQDDKKEKTLKSLINPSTYNQEFTTLTFPFQLHDQIDSNLNLTEIDLRSIALIDLILSDLNIKKYGYANSIYNAMCVFIENQIISKADNIKRILSTKNSQVPDKESFKLNIDELLLFKDCFIDKITGRGTRYEAIDKFSTYFSISSKVKEEQFPFKVT